MSLRRFHSALVLGLLTFLLGACGLLGLPTEKTFYLDHYMEERASSFLSKWS